jgi:prepilin-type N-terminal cleavage/methylation domain-containing protein
MLHIHSRNRRGFTLLELMLGIGLSLIVLLGAGSVYLGVQRSFQWGSRKLLAQQEATLLSSTLSRRIRVAKGYEIYVVPNRGVPADSGNGLALRGDGGVLLGRLEWDGAQQTLVDSTGTRVTSMKLQGVQFRKEVALPKVVRYRFQTDDERGSLVDIESAVTLRN